MKNMSFKEKLERFAYEVGSMIFEARLEAGITQEDLAQKMETQQPSIARAERGSSLPSLTFLFKMADVLNTELIAPKFKFLETSYPSAVEHSFTYLIARALPVTSGWEEMKENKVPLSVVAGMSANAYYGNFNQ